MELLCKSVNLGTVPAVQAWAIFKECPGQYMLMAPFSSKDLRGGQSICDGAVLIGYPRARRHLYIHTLARRQLY